MTGPAWFALLVVVVTAIVAALGYAVGWRDVHDDPDDLARAQRAYGPDQGDRMTGQGWFVVLTAIAGALVALWRMLG